MKKLLESLYTALLIGLIIILLFGINRLIQWSTWHPPTKADIEKANPTFQVVPLVDKSHWYIPNPNEKIKG